MMQIPLQALPNQEFSLILDGNSWDISLKTTDGITSASLTLNGVDILDGAPVVAGAWIIQAAYQNSGNFFFVTHNFQLPAYTQFGVSQSLIYASQAEINALDAPAPPPIKASNFNPIAALPLRFAPIGYT